VKEREEKISFHDWLTLKIIYTAYFYFLIWITLGSIIIIIRRIILFYSYIPAGNIILHVNNEMKRNEMKCFWM
jgi:hypothetical protein